MDGARPALHVTLLGKFCLRLGDVDRPLPPTAHAQSLLAYLLLNRGRAHARPILATLLAPQASEDAARRTLNQSLWYIRRDLPGLLESRPDRVGLDPTYPLTIDIAEFVKLAALDPGGDARRLAQRLNTALDLYQGDLLEGVYEDWTLSERERLRELFLATLERLSAALKACQDYAGALSASQRLVQADPLRESAHRDVMRLQHLLGHDDAALKQYQVCQRFLRDELGLEPEPETTALARELARRSTASSSPFLPDAPAVAGESPLERNAPGEMPLVGRSVEKQALLAALDPQTSPGGKTTVIVGEPGIGKSRLIREARLDVEWHGAVVLEGKSAEPGAVGEHGILARTLRAGLTPMREEQLRALAGQDESPELEGALAYLARLDAPPQPAEGGAVPDRDQRQPLRMELALLLRLWARVTPLLVILEDLHWAGEDDWDLLVELALALHQAGGPGASFLISLRPAEADGQPYIRAGLERLYQAGLAEQIELRPLDRDKSSELARVFLGLQQPLGLLEERLYRESGGNPLFLLESLRMWYEQLVLGRGVDGGWELSLPAEEPGAGRPILAPSIAGVLSRRLAQLSPAVRRALQALAVLGDSFNFTILCALLDCEFPLLFEILRQLLRAHILVETSETYRFTHDLLRQAAYASLDGAERARLHAAAGEALERLNPGESQALAFHFHQAGLWGRAAEYYQQAGLSAIRQFLYHQADQAFSTAVDLAGRAGLSAETRFTLLLQRERTLALVSHQERRARDLEEMRELIEAGGLSEACRLEWLLRQADFAFFTGRYALSEEQARQALALGESHGDEPAITRALYQVGLALHGASREAEAAPYFEQAIPRFHNMGDRSNESRAWRGLTFIYADSARYDQALLAIQASTKLDRLQGNRQALAGDLWMTGWILYEQGDLAGAESLTRESLEISRLTGNRYVQACAESVLVDALVARGELGEAFALFESSIASLREIQEHKLQVSILIDYISAVQRFLGDLDLAVRLNQEAERLSRQSGMERELMCCQAAWGQIACQGGDLGEAGRCAAALEAWLKENDCPPLVFSLEQLRVDIALAARQPQAALHSQVLLEDLCAKHGWRRLELELLSQRATILLGLGSILDAAQAAGQALDHLDAAHKGSFGVPYRAYQALAAAGRMDEALRALDLAAGMLRAALETLNLTQQDQSRVRAPLVGEILTAWERQQPRRVSVILASAGASAGGSGQVSVTWTIYHPADQAITDKVLRRRTQLKRLLEEARSLGASPTQRDLAAALEVSQRTIAQDLAALK